MTLSRRGFVRLLRLGGLGGSRTSPGQGVASHTAKPLARPAPSGRPFNAHLVDVAASAGLHEPVIYGGVESNLIMTRWLDGFVHPYRHATGRRALRNDQPSLKNNRDGTFTDVTEKAGLKAVGCASGVCVGDYNNNDPPRPIAVAVIAGFEDLFCTSFGQNKLYRNNGDGTFTDVTKEAGLWNDQPRWGAGCTFVDYNRDGHLDLFVSPQ